MTETIFCECGMKINGKSEKHLKSNMKIHKKSKNHNILIEAKKHER